MRYLQNTNLNPFETMEYVVLVNEFDEEIGQMEKIEAHKKGALHRAFSVFIFNSRGEVLLQKRAASKYHSPGLWTNTCCSHPRINESVIDAANRRLDEEMGLNADLKFAFDFIYKVEFDNGLFEHEFDHVFYGITDQLPTLNPEEADAYQYLHPDQIEADLKKHPENYTEWFKICFSEAIKNYRV